MKLKALNMWNKFKVCHYFLFVIVIGLKQAFSASNDNCSSRNETIAAGNGRLCRRPCDGEQNICNVASTCSCDHECGLSCIKLNRRCPPPPMVSESASIRIFRRNVDLTPSISEAIYNDLVLYECLPGFALRDIHLKTFCHGHGNWTRAPQCIPSTCPSKDIIAANAVERPCRKSCTPGNNNCETNRICLCDHECGYSCINRDNFCSHPAPVKNMERVKIMRKNDSGEYERLNDLSIRYDDVAEYICKPGFRKEKPFVRSYCHGRKGWTKAPECRRACRRYNEEDVLENRMTCGRACNKDDDCVENLQCLCDGPCGRTCVNADVNCGEASPSNNATIEYTGEGFYRVAHYSCTEGFYVQSGSTTRKCTAGGTWDQLPLICERVTCGDPTPSIRDQFGEVIDWRPGPYYVGHTFSFRCSQGYNLLGSNQRTCMNNGRWSGSNTICDPIDSRTRCPHPGIPINGRLLTRRPSFEIGSSVHFTCNNGYVLVGSPRIDCLYFMQWSENGAPLCIDPKYRDSASDVFQKLQISTRLIRSRSTVELGRFISSSFAPGHEIYFLFDLSRSVRDNELNNSLDFASKLIERLSANATGSVEYGIIIFASDFFVIQDIHNFQPAPSEIIELLRNIGVNRENFQGQIKRGTFTARALQELREQLAFSYVQPEKNSRKRHVFILTDGLHNEGPPPEITVQRIIDEHFENPPEFYSITSCAECSQDGTAVEAYKELLGLANNKRENFILIPNFYLIQEVLDLVTDAPAETDFSPCGRAGDVGSVKQQADPGKVVSGTVATERAWPWQVVVAIFNSLVLETYSSGFRGGGTMINNQWVLTAAHLFSIELQESEDWQSFVFVTYGMHKRPTARSEPLLPITRVFNAERVFIHEQFQFHTVDFDVALIKIGREFVQNGVAWTPTENYGWVNFTSFIRPICLPCIQGNCVGRYLSLRGSFVGSETEEERCSIEIDFLLQREQQNKNLLSVITGFGHVMERRINAASVTSAFLQQGLIKVENDERCTEAVTEDIPWGFRTPIPYTNQMLCGTSGIADANVDACQGDSGGPLAREILLDADGKESCWVQIGIVSWGWGCGLSAPESSRLIPGFYTNVSSVIPWIKAHVDLVQTD